MAKNRTNQINGVLPNIGKKNKKTKFTGYDKNKKTYGKK